MKKQIECDCDCSDTCPQGKTGSAVKCRILKEEPVDVPVPPLDAYKTAKPGEPTWSVQGGDPLGAPLLRVWSHFARLMAGVITPAVLDGVFNELVKAANNNRAETDADENELLIRATETEKVSWQMDSYRKGIGAEAEISREKFTVEDRLDLWDIRRRGASMLSSFEAELFALEGALREKDYLETGDPEAQLVLVHLGNLRTVAKNTRDNLEVKRG